MEYDEEEATTDIGEEIMEITEYDDNIDLCCGFYCVRDDDN